MNYSDKEILDYLPSIRRIDLNTAFVLDTDYIVGKVFRFASCSERAMMFLDFCINFRGNIDNEVVDAIRYYAGSEVLASSVNGVPIIEIAKKCNMPLAAYIYQGVVPENANYDERALNRIVKMFQVDFNHIPENTADAVQRSWDFARREILGDEVQGCMTNKSHV